MRKNVNILIVDADPGDVELTLQVLELNHITTSIEVAENGIAAMDCLLGKNGKPGYRPDLILLDLTMSGNNSNSVIAEIKGNEELKSIPVIVFTASESEDDILYAYKHGASCYISKPKGLEQYIKTIKALDAFWLSYVKYPGKT